MPYRGYVKSSIYLVDYGKQSMRLS